MGHEKASRLVYVVGPSGAGKDSLLSWLVAHGHPALKLHRARRVITRPRVTGGEGHEVVDASTFDQCVRNDELAMHWAANGYQYGIRHSELAALASGDWVLVNGSRAYVPKALAQYPQMCVLVVLADGNLLQQRLQARAREPVQDIQSRLSRQAALPELPHHQRAVVHNNGTLAQAGQAALAALVAWAAAEA